ncbi:MULTISPECIES: GNAT family N-acetyltransferase [unclassified Rhizobium]|uniref:GNAT family N-acetyltransferase n=1 Tax=unclassified Rhizobium TaxID=2613769 RepID=UPI000A6E0D04|nr:MULTISPECIES: GNAT family N-acetyltransferase [unclassified Rhizobium]
MQDTISKADLPNVRRLEAVGFRAWPAASVQYDGSWLIRLTAGHDSKRLNSVNPLDPSDSRDIAIRLEKAARRFSDYGRPLTVRQTPLTPPELIAYMDERHWPVFSETIVMMADIPPNDTTEAVEHLPLRDVGRFVDARLQICGESAQEKAGLSEIINAIKPECGLFLFESPEDGPIAVSLAVHDNDLAGILQVAVADAVRRQGIGSSIVNASLRWARLRGARTAWLAVEASNEPAIQLYRKFGFKDVYRYCYRRAEA